MSAQNKAIVLRVVGGKVAESWASVDQLGIMQQLGLAPSLGQGR